MPRVFFVYFKISKIWLSDESHFFRCPRFPNFQFLNNSFEFIYYHFPCTRRQLSRFYGHCTRGGALYAQIKNIDYFSHWHPWAPVLSHSTICPFIFSRNQDLGIYVYFEGMMPTLVFMMPTFYDTHFLLIKTKKSRMYHIRDQILF